MRIIIDCNVIISAGLTNGNCRGVLQWVLENHTLILSEEILEEYISVISRRKFQRYLAYFQELIINLCQIGLLVKPSTSSYPLIDKSDEKYIAAAEAGQAEILITGNTKHFPEDNYGFIRIMTPASVLHELKG